MEESERTALLALALNLVIFSIKYLAASVSGSIALKAEAFHTFADLVSSLTVIIGLKIAKRKTKSFPYGLYKIENLTSVIISLVIFYSGYQIVLEVINSTSNELRNSDLAILSLLFSVIITFWFSWYEKKIGQKINSPILLADAAHIRTDVLSNTVVLLAVLSNLIGYQLDKIAALIIVGFIAKTGFQIFKDAARVLLDASLDYETLSKIKKIIMDIPQVSELKMLTGRNSGRFKFIEASIALETNDFSKAHFIADKIENYIKNEIKHIDQVLIHYEPLEKDKVIYAFPLTDDQNSISSHFGEVSYFMLVTFQMADKVASKVEVLSNPYSEVERSKGILAAEYLSKNKVNIVIVKNHFESKGPLYVFSNANIEVKLTKGETPQQALKNLGLILSAS